MVAGGPGGSGSTSIAREVPVVVAATEKATETRIAEEAMAVKMTKESAVVMAAEEAIAKVVADAVVMNTVDQGATVGKTTVGSPGSSSSSPPPPVVGSKRVASHLLPCGSVVLGNLGMQSNCIVTLFYSFICVVFD
jgi:hypothetical protein